MIRLIVTSLRMGRVIGRQTLIPTEFVDDVREEPAPEVSPGAASEQQSGTSRETRSTAPGHDDDKSE